MMTCHRLFVLAAAVSAAVSVGCKRSDDSAASGKTSQEPVKGTAKATGQPDKAKPKTPPPTKVGAVTRTFVVGKPAPEFALPRLKDGKPMSLAQLRGKKTLLLVFASW